MEPSQAACFSHPYWDLSGSLSPSVSMCFSHTSECQINSSGVNVMKDLLCAGPRNMPLDPQKSPVRSSLFWAPSYREVTEARREEATHQRWHRWPWGAGPDFRTIPALALLTSLRKKVPVGFIRSPPSSSRDPQKTIHGNRKRQIPATLI